MSQPVPYNRFTSFTTYQQEHPSDPLRGSDVDAEYNRILETLSGILQNLLLIQRDDGELANDSVHLDQLGDDVNLGFGPPSPWQSGVAYIATFNTVFFAGKFYKALVSHTSGDFATDLAAGKWGLIADFTTLTDTLSDLTAAESSVASATTALVGASTTFRVLITGTTTITAFDVVANKVRFVRFQGALTLTNSGSLVLPGGANIVTAANDTAIFQSDGVGTTWRCTDYQRADATTLATSEVIVPSATTCDIGSAASERVLINGTTTITSLGTVPNKVRFVRFAAALLLTHNGTSLILPHGASANISTAANDTAIFESDTSGNWRCMSYQRANGTPLDNAEVAIASASTCDIGNVGSVRVGVTGTTTITSFGTRPNTARFVRFGAALTLTNNNTSLILPGGINILAAANDIGLFMSDPSGNWRCFLYQKASGEPLDTLLTDIASATTTDIGSVASNQIQVTGTTTITSFGTVPNRLRYVRFLSSLTLTHNASTLVLPGSNSIQTQTGDIGIFQSDSSGNWKCVTYQRANGQPGRTVAKTSGFTVADADDGATFELGGNSLYTIIVNAGSTYVSDRHSVRFVNIDTLRWKVIQIADGSQTITLKPGQWLDVQKLDGLMVARPPGRWKLPGNLTVYVVGAAGSSSNDGMVAGSPIDLATAMKRNSDRDIDIGVNSVIVQFADGTYPPSRCIRPVEHDRKSSAFQGNVSNRISRLLFRATGNDAVVYLKDMTLATITDMTLKTTGNGSEALKAEQFAVLDFGRIGF